MFPKAWIILGAGFVTVALAGTASAAQIISDETEVIQLEGGSDQTICGTFGTYTLDAELRLRRIDWDNGHRRLEGSVAGSIFDGSGALVLEITGSGRGSGWIADTEEASERIAVTGHVVGICVADGTADFECRVHITDSGDSGVHVERVWGSNCEIFGGGETQEGEPGPGAVLVLGAVAAVAIVARRRR